MSSDSEENSEDPDGGLVNLQAYLPRGMARTLEIQSEVRMARQRDEELLHNNSETNFENSSIVDQKQFRNTEVGKGYQAAGVVRQRGMAVGTGGNVVDMTKRARDPSPAASSFTSGSNTSEDRGQKHKHKHKKKKAKKHKSDKKKKRGKHKHHRKERRQKEGEEEGASQELDLDHQGEVVTADILGEADACMGHISCFYRATSTTKQGNFCAERARPALQMLRDLLEAFT
jgi:hypothetical protein